MGWIGILFSEIIIRVMGNKIGVWSVCLILKL